MKTITAILFLVAASLAQAATPSQEALCSDTHVQRNGVEVFCAACIDPHGNVVNYTGNCGGAPPPPDSHAYSRLTVSYNVNGQLRAVTNVDMSLLQNLFGRSTNTATTIPYPYVNGSTIVFTGQPNMYVRARLAVPMNPGTLYHTIKGAANFSVPQNAEFKIQVVPPGAAWNSIPEGACRNDHGLFNYGGALTITPNVNDASSVRCKTPPGTQWDVLIGMVDSTLRATQSYSWY